MEEEFGEGITELFVTDPFHDIIKVKFMYHQRRRTHMQYKGKEITNELLEKAKQCTDVQELLKLAAENGVELSAEEAEAFLDETLDIELDEEALDVAVGGRLGSCPTRKSECSLNKKYD